MAVDRPDGTARHGRIPWPKDRPAERHWESGPEALEESGARRVRGYRAEQGERVSL
jgi:hypothetical protein